MKKRKREKEAGCGVSRVPRKALRGGISKVNFNQFCQLLTTISHKMAPRTRQSEAGITPRRAFCGSARVSRGWNDPLLIRWNDPWGSFHLIRKPSQIYYALIITNTSSSSFRAFHAAEKREKTVQVGGFVDKRAMHAFAARDACMGTSLIRDSTPP